MNLHSRRLSVFCVTWFALWGLAAPRPAIGVTIAWTGGAGTNSWHNPANWNLNRVPGNPGFADDDVVIPDMTPNVNVTYSTGTRTIRSLISHEAFTLSGGALTVDTTATFAGHLSITGGTATFSGDVGVAHGLTLSYGAKLAGTGTVTVTDVSTWGGIMDGAGTTVFNNHVTILGGVGGAEMTNSRTVKIESTAMFAPEHEFDHFKLSTGSTLVIESTGEFAMNGNDGEYIEVSVSGRIDNYGRFIHSGATEAARAQVYPEFNNYGPDGKARVDAGVMYLYGGNTPGMSSTGDFAPAPGTTLKLYGTNTISEGATMTGTGTLEVAGGTTTFDSGVTTFSAPSGSLAVSGGTVTFNADASFSGVLNLSAGYLAGTGTVTFGATSPSTWHGGIMDGGGTTGTTVFNGHLNLLGNAQMTNNRKVQVAGSATFTPEYGFEHLTIGAGSNLEIEGTGTFTMGNDNAYIGGSGTIENYGLFSKSSGPGDASVEPQFNNHGAIGVATGALNLFGGGTSTGDFHPTSGALRLYGTNTISEGATMTGTGTLEVASGTTTVNGIFNIAGNFTLQSGAVLDLTILASSPGTGFDQVNVIGNATLSGALTIGHGAWVPCAGDTFKVFTYCGTLTNMFTGGITVSLWGTVSMAPTWTGPSAPCPLPLPNRGNLMLTSSGGIASDTDGDDTADCNDTCTDSDDDDFGDPGFAANTCPDDNCPSIYNQNLVATDCNGDGDTSDPGEGVGEQCDSDGDGQGDACDLDDDNDGIYDDIDTAPTTSSHHFSDGTTEGTLNVPAGHHFTARDASDPGEGIEVLLPNDGAPTPFLLIFEGACGWPDDVFAFVIKHTPSKFKLTCGSIIVEAVQGSITVPLVIAGTNHEVSVTSGATAELAPAATANGQLASVQVIASGTGQIIVDGAVLPSGQSTTVCPTQPDTDGDGIGDACDLCPARRPGDVNGDGVANTNDVGPFIAVLMNPTGAAPNDSCAADVNASGSANTADIQALVHLLTGQ